MLILSLILAHLLADFYLQTDEMVKEKRKSIRKHMVHHFILTAMVLMIFWIFEGDYKNIIEIVVMPVFFIVLSHFLIDLLKIMLLDTFNINNDRNMKLCFFILDQLLHIAVIILTCHLFFGKKLSRFIERFLEVLLGNGSLSHVNSFLFIIIVIILTTSVSGHIIKILLGSLPTQLLTFEGKYSFKNERKETYLENKNGISEEYNYTIFNKHDLSRGKLIGYIERLLVLLLTFYSAYPAIGFIVAAKSIARFKQMDDRDWAEYFLLGTLTSMFLGIGFGILLREVLT